MIKTYCLLLNLLVGVAFTLTAALVVVLDYNEPSEPWEFVPTTHTMKDTP